MEEWPSRKRFKLISKSHPRAAQESSQICYKITRDCSNSGTGALGTQWIQSNHRDFYNIWTCSLDCCCVLQWPYTARSPLSIHKYSIYTYTLYKRLNYGKSMHNRACCYVACNCQSKRSVYTCLDEYVKALSWKPPYLNLLKPVPLLA